jgi:hypothetical protein
MCFTSTYVTTANTTRLLPATTYNIAFSTATKYGSFRHSTTPGCKITEDALAGCAEGDWQTLISSDQRGDYVGVPELGSIFFPCYHHAPHYLIATNGIFG